MYHIFLIHSFVDGHLGCLYTWAIVNDSAVNMAVQLFLRSFFSSFAYTLRSEIAGSYMVVLFLICWGTSILCSMVAVPSAVSPFCAVVARENTLYDFSSFTFLEVYWWIFMGIRKEGVVFCWMECSVNLNLVDWWCAVLYLWWYFCLIILLLWEGWWSFNCNCKLVCFFPFSSSRLFHVFGSSFVYCIHI